MWMVNSRYVPRISLNRISFFVLAAMSIFGNVLHFFIKLNSSSERVFMMLDVFVE
jgi:hypothetical protein